MREAALAEAAEADREIAAGRYRGPLHGIPITVKDLVDVAARRRRPASKVPAAIARPTRRSSSGCARPARSSSARPTCTSSRSARPATRPRSAPSATRSIRTRSAGGSSGGSAAAVVDGHVLRLGRHRHRRLDPHPRRRLRHRRTEADARRELPCDGVVPLSTTLDHVGPLARSVADAGLLFQAMKASSVHGIAPAGGALTFGVPRQYFFDGSTPESAQSRRRTPSRGSSRPATRVRDTAIEQRRVHARRLPAHLPAGSLVLSRRNADRARGSLLAGRPAAARDGPLPPGGGLRARDAAARAS